MRNEFNGTKNNNERNTLCLSFINIIALSYFQTYNLYVTTPFKNNIKKEKICFVTAAVKITKMVKNNENGENLTYLLRFLNLQDSSFFVFNFITEKSFNACIKYRRLTFLFASKKLL